MEQLMNQQYNRTVAETGEIDLGLKSFMLGTYRYMALAMAVTASVAFLAKDILPHAVLRGNPFILLGFVIAIPLLFGSVGAKLPTMSKAGVLRFLFVFAAFLGIFMSAIAAFVPGVIVAKVFFMTVAMFGALSLFGYTTERNLGTYAKYAFAAFLVYIVMSLVFAFIPGMAPEAGGAVFNTMNLIVLGAIAMITAWETQMLKRTYYSFSGNDLMLEKLSAYGAASLLLSFVNMFQILLSLFGRE